jgi:hypothetical protein
MHTHNARAAEPLRIVTDELVEQTEHARAEQLARVARQLVGDPSLGITQVRVFGPLYDDTFSAATQHEAADAASVEPAVARRALFLPFRARRPRRRPA